MSHLSWKRMRVWRWLVVALVGVWWGWPATAEVQAAVVVVNQGAADCVTGSGQANPYAVVYCRIQDAIVDAAPNDLLTVAAGTYAEALHINKAVTVVGSSASGVVVDATGLNQATIRVTADNVSLSGMTLRGAAGIAGYGLRVDGASHITISQIIVQNSQRTGVYLHGANDVVLQDVAVSGAMVGNGFALMDSNDVLATNLTTSGNVWGAFAIYTLGQTYPIGSNNINLNGVSFAEPIKLYTQMGNFGDPANPVPITNLSAPDFTFTVRNHTFRADAPNFTYYQPNLAEAVQFALNLPTPQDSYVNDIASGDFWVGPYGGVMRIQTAVNYAPPGSVIRFMAGVYPESFTVNKHLALIGMGSGADPASNTILRKGSETAVLTLAASGESAADPILLQNLRVEPVNVTGLAVLSGTVSYVRLDNVQVIGATSDTASENEVGLRVGTAASLHYLEVANSAFNDLAYGWHFAKQGGSSDVRDLNVSDTEFRRNDVAGIYAEKLANVSLEDVVLDGNGAHSTLGAAEWGAGFDLNLAEGTAENILFSNVTMSGNGLGMREGAGLSIRLGETAVVTHVTVIGGSFSGNERGIRLGGAGQSNVGLSGVTIQQADIVGNVPVYGGGDGSAYGGVMNHSPQEVVATHNWWGDDSGPSGAGSGSGDAVSAVVLFCPWLNAEGLPTGDCGTEPTHATITIAKTAVDVPANPTINFKFEGDLGNFGIKASESISFTVLPGNYSIVEKELANWGLVGVSCAGGNSSSIPNGVSVGVAAGDVVTCMFTNAPTCDDPRADLRGYMNGPATHSFVTNSSTAFCAWEVGMASYMKLDEDIDHQILFDYVDEVVILAGETVTMTVALPVCATQVDVFWGEVLFSLDGQRYGSRLITARHMPGNGYCTADLLSVSGVVMVDDEPLAGVVVTLAEQEETAAQGLFRPLDPIQLETVTDEAGMYRLERLPIGTYQLTLSGDVLEGLYLPSDTAQIVVNGVDVPVVHFEAQVRPPTAVVLSAVGVGSTSDSLLVIGYLLLVIGYSLVVMLRRRQFPVTNNE
ncbi:MAG: hypothetical protein OT477_19555 [Chloroflexi bacterium]|nr:hypothetical protein [Chloroflexota bacterium]